MKKMIAFAALALALLGFGGCRGKTPPPEDKASLPPEGEVVSLSLGAGHMTRDSFYSFYLREKDGQVLFAAHFWIMEDGGDIREITLESAAAAPEDLAVLRALCREYGFAERQQTYRKPTPDPNLFIADAPMFGLDVRWENGARLDADTAFGSEQALRDFFEALANRLQ
jgi:hypothetical protein